ISVFAEITDDYPIYACRKNGYFGQKSRVGLGRIESEWAIPVRPVDKIVLDRLIALAEYDNGLVERVKTYFGNAAHEGQSALVVLDTAIRKTQAAIKKLSRTIVLLTQKDVENEDGEDTEDTEELDPNDLIVKE